MSTPYQAVPQRLHVLGLFAFALMSLFIAGCSSSSEETPEPAAVAEVAPEPVSLDRAVLDDPSRPQDEREQDVDRKPIDVYEFFGVQPGQTVADVYNSDGYNTHLLSRLVGDGGTVYSVFEFYSERELFDGALYKVDVVSERLEDAGLANVTLALRLVDVPSESVDVAVAIRNYHDVEWVFPDMKRADQLAEFFRILKPGGIVGIVEVATPNEGWDELAHRLNKQVVINDFTGAGFEWVEESDLLAVAGDDYTVDGFPKRHKTDRYALKFVKLGN